MADPRGKSILRFACRRKTVAAQEELLLPIARVGPGKTGLILLVVKCGVPAFGHNGVINRLGLDGGGGLVRRGERKGVAPAEMLDFYGPTRQFHALAAARVGVFEQALGPKILHLDPSDWLGLVNRLAWTLLGHRLKRTLVAPSLSTAEAQPAASGRRQVSNLAGQQRFLGSHGRQMIARQIWRSVMR